MGIMPGLEQRNEIINIWQIIRWRMNVHKITPQQLSLTTGYSRGHIERGLKGEPIEIGISFLRDCVMAFGLTSGRTRYYEETVENLSWEECVRLLKPTPAMPPRQGDFWDYLE